MLVPEISLTSQTVNRFVARFGADKIAVLHSKLSQTERYEEWMKVYNNKAKIVIGARSAIFAPVNNLGIVIIDEEHDSSYKSESTPKFATRDIAKYYAKTANCPLLLGSATPNVNIFYEAIENNNIAVLELTKRANDSKLPNVEIIDLVEEKVNGNESMISNKLKAEILKNIMDNKQTILFLNRRGFSTYVLCTDCGETVKCKNCNINLTYHQKDGTLRCHYCGLKRNVIYKCDSCNSSHIEFLGGGTQKIELEINRLFPSATTIRMDVDTITANTSHEDIIEKFKEENINILIGTQMVAKGHHFPKVTLVGIILADSSLNIADFRANENTFQLLTQVAGRAGREGDEGRVIIQTYNPENAVIEFAKEQNYENFYNAEINIRKMLKYPPFCDIIVVNLFSENEIEVKNAIEFVYKTLIRLGIERKALIFKPQPSPIDKIKNKFRWRILIKTKFNNDMISLLEKVLKEFWSKNKLYKKTNISIDVNPNNMS